MTQNIDHQKRVYNSILELLCNEENPTPLVRLNHVTPLKKAQIFAKLEWYNPFGAVKDRVANNLLLDAEQNGRLDNVKSLVEPTSGNTGFALTMIANAKHLGIKSPLSSMIPLEKRTLLKFFGCDVVELTDTLCPAPGAPEGAIAMAMETATKPGFLMLNQYANEANPMAHYLTTGPEIWKQTDQKVTHFVAGLGTCGTITGTGTFLKDKNPAIKVIGVHPEEGHDIPGVRSIRQLQQTKLFRPELYDQLVQVSNREAFDMCLRINREESIIAGPSSAMALVGALKVIQDEPNAVVVIIFPDNAFKYASSFQRHFPQMFANTVGASSNPNTQNTASDESLNKMIELCRNEFNTIDLELAHQSRNREKPIYIDVRDPEQFKTSHIEGAINISNQTLLEGNSKLPQDKNQAIVTVCNRGNISLKGLLILKSLGYTNVKSLNGGIIGWQEKNYPMVTSQKK